MKFDLIVAGVGGQGILSISFVVDNASLEDGLHFKQSEVHGMAQRGGAVVSHLRISDEQIFSDLVPGASADMILSMEPLEALRYMHYLSPGGRVISSINPVVNIPDYPDEAELLDRLQEQCAGSVLVNAAELARAAGSPRAQNMVLLGAASRHLPLEIKTLEKFVGVLFKAKGERVVDVNMTAFRGGALAGAFYENLIAAGVGAADAAAVATRLEPVDYSAASAAPTPAAIRFS